MPTVIWIQEAAEDRFYEGQGFVLSPPRPLVFPCAICGDEFDESDLRSWHVSEAHPLARPMLFVRGVLAPTTVIVRKPLCDRDVTVDNCTSVRAVRDGVIVEGVSPEGIGDLVVSTGAGRWSLELENRRAQDAADVVARYEIEVAIPMPAELEAVDRAFVSRLAVDQPTTRDIESFANDVARLASAREYAGCLADYVQGVLAKEGSGAGGSTLPFDAFQAKFNRALAGLSEHIARPVAAAVVAAARLNLNDLESPVVTSGDPLLDGCSSALQEIATQSLQHADWASPEHALGAPLCPIDRDTHYVLAAFARLFGNESGSRHPQMEERVESGMLSSFDRAKLRALLAASLLRAGALAAARRHLEVLTHDAVFGPWALDRLGGRT